MSSVKGRGWCGDVGRGGGGGYKLKWCRWSGVGRGRGKGGRFIDVLLLFVRAMTCVVSWKVNEVSVVA